MFTALLILSTLAAPPKDSEAVATVVSAPVAGGDEVFACAFETAADRDYNSWPDGWTRRITPDLPPFVRVTIVPEGKTVAEANRESISASGNCVLRVELDGGGASLARPAIAVGSHYSLRLSLRVRTSGLKNDGAWATLSLVDAQGKTVESIGSRPVCEAGDWQTVQIGPITPSSTQIATAVVSLHVEPLSEAEDLTGWAEFDDVSLVCLPRMTLEADSTAGLYVDREQPQITCAVSGIRSKQPQVLFELVDVAGQVRATHTTPLLVPRGGLPGGSAPATGIGGDSGQAYWSPAIPDYGYYQIRASLHSAESSTPLLSRVLTVAMLRPLPAIARSEFGWSLPGGKRPYAYGTLPQILGQAGLGWAKVPVWYDASETQEIEQIAWLAEQFSIQNIELVGVLDQPPKELRQVFREEGRLPVASVFIEPDLWQPVVSPVLTRLSLKVRWWQLGDDQDNSFVGFPGVEAKIAEIKKHLEQYGQEVRLGMGWRWLEEDPRAPQRGATPWAYLSYGADPELTAEEIAAYLAAPPEAPHTEGESTFTSTRFGARIANGDPGSAPRSRRTTASVVPKAEPTPVRRWLVLQPLARDEYGQPTRVDDLVQRMLAAKIHGAHAVFVPQPFDEDRGLMNADGSPGELFLPWRTTALLVGGSQYVGAMQLPGNSQCEVFVRDKEAVLAIWNDRPSTERLLLGDEPQRIDVWGRATVPPRVEEGGQAWHELEVGPTPVFVTGQSAGVARWQAGLEFESQRLASVFDQQQTITVRVPNGFGQGISGELTLHAPPSWKVDARPTRFKVGEGDELKLPLPVTLDGAANSGPQAVRLDFEIAADRSYRFSVHRSLQLGLEDVQIELNTRLREDGALVVEQQLTNVSGHPVSFQCLLFPPGRRREMRQVIQASQGRTALTFVLPAGEELIGQKLWLRAEEIGGPRVLNHTIVAER